MDLHLNYDSLNYCGMFNISHARSDELFALLNKVGTEIMLKKNDYLMDEGDVLSYRCGKVLEKLLSITSDYQEKLFILNASYPIIDTIRKLMGCNQPG